jgi:hypothetical protein
MFPVNQPNQSREETAPVYFSQPPIFPAMNEPNPEIVPIESTVASYQNRSTGLTIFGILTIMMGCLAALLIPLMLLGQVMATKNTGSPASFLTLLPVILVYGLLAVALVWLGIGSIQARRWARALLLIFSWSWLAVGLLTILSTAVFMPKMMANLSATGASGSSALPPSALAVVMLFMFVFYGVLFVILPAIWIFFYHSRHVKATCEARDPVACWTDACPLPVLALCLWLLFGVPMLLIMPLTGHVGMPFFGLLLTGLPGTLLCLATAALWIFAAWRMYQLDVRGWWLIFAVMMVFLVSVMLTFAHHDMLEMYQLMGYPEAQIELMKKSGLLEGNRMNRLMSFSAVPLLGYLLFIKKYFSRKS